MTLTNTIKEFNTLSTIKEIFGDAEFTKKQYDYVRHVTGNQLLTLDAITDGWYDEGVSCLKRRKEALFGNGLDDEPVYIMEQEPNKWNGDMEVTKSIPVKEIEKLPKKARKYIKDNMVEENKYLVAKHSSSYRNIFSVNEKRIDVHLDCLKKRIKEYTSDYEITELERQLKALQNRIAIMLKVKEEFED